MRLTQPGIDAIKSCAERAFGPSCVVRLFGSRVDDARRGGDIDLHIVASVETATLHNEMEFRGRLEEAIGERWVDVVLRRETLPPGPIDDVAISGGLVL